MSSIKIDEMIRGWFIGSFIPTAFDTKVCEVALKKYTVGDYEEAHFHRIATEITLVISGKVRMLDREWGEGEIIIIKPNEVTDFLALSDTVSVVVKIPGANNDKFSP